MNIRFACEADIPGMLALLRQVGEVHHRIRPDIFRDGAQKYDENDLKTLLEDENRPIFIAAEGDFVAGYCFCIRKETKDSGVLNDRRELYIDDLCVDENRRGRGIASRLYRHACGYAREQGFDVVTLNVWSGNDSAMHFYEKCGLKPQKVTMEMIL